MEPDYKATNKSCLDLRIRISLNVDLCPCSPGSSQLQLFPGATTLWPSPGQSGLLWPISRPSFSSGSSPAHLLCQGPFLGTTYLDGIGRQ